jgi:hypothetical protein
MQGTRAIGYGTILYAADKYRDRWLLEMLLAHSHYFNRLGAA